MCRILGLDSTKVNKKLRELMERAVADKHPALSDSLKDKLTQHYVHWRYILAKLDCENADVKKLFDLRGQMDDEILATELSYLWIRLSTFVIHQLPPPFHVTLDKLKAGLTNYGMGSPNTLAAAEVLFKFVKGQ